MIQTGKKPIGIMAFWAIMSLSFIVNLPGLAVTPMLGTLKTVFPHSTQIEEQLLTVLPNLLIIPFVLLSGKLSLTRHKTAAIVSALALFVGSAVWYLFARSMSQLIIISCLLGIGAGLIIPFSTGLIADTFSGSYRMRYMGVQSGISNATLVAATFAVGWLSHGNWHLPFIVYLVGLIPLAFCFWLKKVPHNDIDPTAADVEDSDEADDASTNTETEDEPETEGTAVPVVNPSQGIKVYKGFYIDRIWALIAVYFIITFSSISISYYCPFLIEKHDWSASLAGTITAIYFLFIFMPGFFLSFFARLMKAHTFFYSGLIMTVGLALFSFVPVPFVMCIGAALAGLGYGICQPLIYDKASHAVKDSKKATLALSFVLTANYLAIVIAPFIISLLRSMCHIQKGGTFAFVVCFIVLVLYSSAAYIWRNKFAFSLDKSYYSKKS